MVLFVDNKEENLLPAEKLGWKTILATPDEKWINEVDKLLKNGTN
ncbi:hypothetical protein SAMN04487944_11127 [Gracilibacillus ureilyticus]|uniref:Hydrolase of the HAD superfamily n=1 Tax=Gracilibacillus ureilyticus TaxID=531814 RepID=A0A1H9SGQ9_9BACI|nr:hypothetical protein [Gracilibacillus ureilyticus]SER84162.1 hypothetical protein SAMN04487944_11127 [Gracilibacillus ureilyticus]